MATTRTARSPNFGDVDQAVNGGGPWSGALVNGDIVHVPAGPAVWGTSDVLTLNADVSLLGAGADMLHTTPSDSVATNITCQNPQFIVCNFKGSVFPTQISGFSLELTVVDSHKYLFTLAGKAYRRRVSGDIVGGLRVNDIRLRNTADPSVLPLLFQWGGPPSGSGAGTFITGSFDHNFLDFPLSDSNELSTFGCAGSPNGSSPDGWGQWMCGQFYLHGGGDDSELDVIYVEDNIFHKTGFVLGTLQGGGRIVARHNTAWGPIAGHGIDSGGNCGTTSWECYNNFFDLKNKASQACFNTRGGTQVIFNNRATNVAGSSKMISTGTYRPTSTTSAMIGSPTGRNFLDKNQRGIFSVNGASFTPVVADNADIRIGSVYAKGVNPTVNTPGKDYTLTGIDGTKGANAWAGFVLNNTDSLSSEDLGEQGVQIGTQGLGYGFITGSTDVNATTVRVTVAGGGNGIFNLTNVQHWEIRKVITYFAGPGAGKIPFLTNGGMNKNKLPNTGIADTTGYAYQTSKANADGQGNAKFKYFSDPYAFGIWQKYNLSRLSSATDWNTVIPVTIASNSAQAKTYPGGLNDDLPNPSGNDGTGGAYPMYAGNAATLRVGADWNAEGFSEGISQGEHGCPALAGGATYPNAMVSAVVTPRIISPASVAFTAGVGGTFQVQVADFSVAPTFSKSGSFPASGSTFSSGGLLTVGAGSAAGVYAFSITATHLTESATQNPFTLTITASPTRVIALSGSLAFGNVDINTTSQKNLTITNNGNTTLTVSSISLPSGFTANWTSGDIAPGGNQLVIVTFAPVAGTSYSGTVTVTSNSTSGTNTTAASGLGATRVITITGSLVFGNITTGQTATRVLTVTNDGNVSMAISSVTYPEGFSGNYSSGTLAAGASVNVNVTFSPTLVQAYSGNVDFTTNKTSGTNTVAATGTGTAAATKIVQLSGSLAFGSVETGTTLTKALTITNSGTATLTVTDLTLPSGYASDWTAGTIAAGASQIANITFSPVAAITYNGTATVVSDATGGTNTTAVTGTGTASSTKIIGLSGNMVFGNVETGTTVTRVLTIANSGTAILTVSSITLPTGFTGSFAGTVAVGATHDVNITFSPVANQGYSGTITVVSDKTSGTNTIAASGAGVAPSTRVISLSGNLAFGNVQKKHTQQRTFVITNNGTADLTVTNITCPTGFSSNITTATIPAKGTQNVVVTFAPQLTQDYGGTITVASDATSGVSTIICSGTGTNKRQVPFFLIVS